MKLSQLKSGFAALNAADWVDGLPFQLLGDVSLKVRRLYTPEWLALQQGLAKESSDLSVEANAARIERECIARTVIEDWRGIDDAYTPDLAIELLADAEAGPVFRSAVLFAVAKREASIRDAIEAAEKN